MGGLFATTTTIIIVLVSIIGLTAVIVSSSPVAYGQEVQFDETEDNSETGTIGNSIHTYEDPDIGISFQYPSHWTVQKEPLGVSIDIGEGIGFNVDVVPLNILSPPITTLKDFARYQYVNDPLFNAATPNVINDNQTTVAGDHPALQMEYSFEVTIQRHGLTVWTIDRGIGYDFNSVADEGAEFFDNIPSIREMLNSIEFIPLTPAPKQPSFMD